MNHSQNVSQPKVAVQTNVSTQANKTATENNLKVTQHNVSVSRVNVTNSTPHEVQALKTNKTTNSTTNLTANSTSYQVSATKNNQTLSKDVKIVSFNLTKNNTEDAAAFLGKHKKNKNKNKVVEQILKAVENDATRKKIEDALPKDALVGKNLTHNKTLGSS